MKHYDLVILGSGSIAQSILRNFQSKSVLIVGRSAKNIEAEFGVDTVNWNAGLDDFPKGISADKVVNAIMPTTAKVAIAAINLALNLVASPNHYYHLSTIAVFARPRGRIARTFFSGDNYIRVKLAELNYLKANVPGCNVIYPGIVVGSSTNWQRYFNSISDAVPFQVGFDISKPAPIIELDELGKKLCLLIASEYVALQEFIPRLDDVCLPTWENFLLQYCPKIIEKKYEFYDNFLLNAIVTILVSKVIPVSLLHVMNKRRVNTRQFSVESTDAVKNLENARTSANGMTNFYMGCDYVL